MGRRGYLSVLIACLATVAASTTLLARESQRWPEEVASANRIYQRAAYETWKSIIKPEFMKCCGEVLAIAATETRVEFTRDPTGIRAFAYGHPVLRSSVVISAGTISLIDSVSDAALLNEAGMTPRGAFQDYIFYVADFMRGLYEPPASSFEDFIAGRLPLSAAEERRFLQDIMDYRENREHQGLRQIYLEASIAFLMLHEFAHIIHEDHQIPEKGDERISAEVRADRFAVENLISYGTSPLFVYPFFMVLAVVDGELENESHPLGICRMITVMEAGFRTGASDEEFLSANPEFKDDLADWREKMRPFSRQYRCN